MKPKTGNNVLSFVVIAAVLAIAAVAPPAIAVDLPPGGAVALPGAGGSGGTVIRDQLIPFEIHNAFGSLLYAGVVQDRVVRRADDKLIFSKRIRDTQGGLNGYVTAAYVTDYAGSSTDVDYSPSGLGQHVPDWATRTGDGVLINYEFNNDPVWSGDESRFFFAETDVEYYSVNGSMTIIIATGQSATITVACPFSDDTPPVAEIHEPTGLECACNPVQVTGIAYDPDGTYESDRLEYRPAAGGAWTLIGQASVPVPPPGGNLYSWNTTSVSQGYYLLRLTVVNTVGLESSDVVVVWVDKQFDSFDFTSPPSGEVVGGNVCPHGMIWDHCVEQFSVEYAPQGGVFQPIEPGTPVYNGDRLNLTFAVWDTLPIPDGDYDLRVTVWDECGHTEFQQHDIIVDNTPPTVQITSPEPCTGVSGIVEIVGTAFDANLDDWVVQYTGGSAGSWVTIASGNNNVNNGTLAFWDTTGLPACPYTIRVVAHDTARLNCNSAYRHRSEYTVSVLLGGCDGDTNGDGVVDVLDLLQVLSAWGPCP